MTNCDDHLLIQVLTEGVNFFVKDEGLEANFWRFKNYCFCQKVPHSPFGH